MGVSFNHQVYFVCEKDESEYVKELPERLPGGWWGDTPVYDKKVEDNIVSFSSSGYNIYDLFGPDFPRPESWIRCVHRISPCQGQEFDVVDWISRSEFDDKYEDVDDEDEGYNPMGEYCDPDSEYWEENSHLNVYTHEEEQWTKYRDEHLVDEDDEDDLMDKFRYEVWEDYIYNTQDKDIRDGLKVS